MFLVNLFKTLFNEKSKNDSSANVSTLRLCDLKSEPLKEGDIVDCLRYNMVNQD